MLQNDLFDTYHIDPVQNRAKLERFFNQVLVFKLGEKTVAKNGQNHQFLSLQHHIFKPTHPRSTIPSIKDKTSQKRLKRNSVSSSTESITIQTECDTVIEKDEENFTGTKNDSLPQIHNGFSCDHCLIDPIVGNRYNCEQCDFDLCQTCFQKCTQKREQIHEHDLRVAKKISHTPLSANLSHSHGHSQKHIRILRQKLTKSWNLGQSK